MTVFAVISLENPAAINQAIASSYPGSYLALSGNAWLVSDTATSKDVSDKLRITEGTAKGPAGAGVVFAINGYFGNANPAIWEFIQKKS